METMALVVSILSALLLTHVCTGDKSCEIWSSAGLVVQRNSTFQVYCTFKFNCKGSMYSGHRPLVQFHRKHNETTIYLDVAHLSDHRTFSCNCDDPSSNTDPCGLDILAGYPPDRPANFSCVHQISEFNHSSTVECKWASGRQTYIRSNAKLWVRTFSHNTSGADEVSSVSAKGSSSVAASFTVDTSVQVVSVWASVTNQLGSAQTHQKNYTLSDIMMPPVPAPPQVHCWSRNCSIKVQQKVQTFALNIDYRDVEEEQWTPHPNVSNGLVESLQPYTLYQFRARSKFATGLWSDWSRPVSVRTQEEAPERALDVWYAVDPRTESMRVYWKKLPLYVAHGKILDYTITVYHQNSVQTLNGSSDKQNISVPLCSDCDVTVSARNTKGHSPPANITIHTSEAKDVLVPVINKNNVTLCWRQHASAALPLDCVVEWFPRGQKLEKMQWLRISGNSSQVVITDMEPFQCYEGSVYVFYSDKSMDRLRFSDISIADLAPTAGPSVERLVEGTTVNVNWSEPDVGQHKGCITTYTIYLENSSRFVTTYNVSASLRFHVISGLSPAAYSIWMTASTAKGEGKPGQKINFFIQHSQMALIVKLALLAVFMLFILCACHIPAVKERMWVYLQYFMPDIPDPANSKWAKDCLKEKDVSLHPQLSTTTETEEEDLVCVQIQDLPRPLLSPQTSLTSDTDLRPLYPEIIYITSLSHESDCSGHTQTISLDTNDYMSSHGTEAMSEAEDNEDFNTFFPSHSYFPEQLDFGPKLTLDAVRIGGGDFFSLAS
ncbi:unnamed protein product [Knipowitschia caucasica]